MDLIPFKNLIKERTGLSFEDIRSVKLAHAIRDMMSRSGIDRVDEYFTRLLQDRSEFIDLIDHLTINETYFFREPVHMKVLCDTLIPDLLRGRKPETKIRILSAGCSTGEEPYSLVMAIMEKYGTGITRLLDVVGVDIDSSAIRKAKRAVYGKQSFRHFDLDLKKKYFTRVGTDLYEVKAHVREPVTFQRINLADGTNPDPLAGMDIVFYRNVSIYLDSRVQKKVFDNLAKILNENGCLFLSATETLSHNRNRTELKLIELQGVFLFQKSTGPSHEGEHRKATAKVRSQAGLDGRFGEDAQAEMRPSPISSPPSGDAANRALGSLSDLLRSLSQRPGQAPGSEHPSRAEEDDPDALYEKALSFSRAKKYGEALDVVDHILENHPELLKAFTLKANLLIHLDRLGEAEAICTKALGIDQLCLEAYMLLAMTARMRNDEECSIKRFKEALYIRSSCWPAHFYLAELYHSRGDSENAAREFGIVVKLLEKGGFSDTGLTLFPLSIPVEQLVHLCRSKLSHLDAPAGYAAK